ncbi:hypothetical protein ACU686_29385 [Yinghuangia aomiensis]
MVTRSNIEIEAVPPADPQSRLDLGQRRPQGRPPSRLRGPSTGARRSSTTSSTARSRCTARSATPTDLPLEEMYRLARNFRLADGADEVHIQQIAKMILRRYEAVDGWPTEHVPTRRAAAELRHADWLDLPAPGSAP